MPSTPHNALPEWLGIMINPNVVVVVIHVADMDEAYGTYAADDE